MITGGRTRAGAGRLQSLGPRPVHQHRDQPVMRHRLGLPPGRRLFLPQLNVLLGTLDVSPLIGRSAVGFTVPDLADPPRHPHGRPPQLLILRRSECPGPGRRARRRARRPRWIAAAGTRWLRLAQFLKTARSAVRAGAQRHCRDCTIGGCAGRMRHSRRSVSAVDVPWTAGPMEHRPVRQSSRAA
jgi:hypothetical protein